MAILAPPGHLGLIPSAKNAKFGICTHSGGLAPYPIRSRGPYVSLLDMLIDRQRDEEAWGGSD